MHRAILSYAKLHTLFISMYLFRNTSKSQFCCARQLNNSIGEIKCGSCPLEPETQVLNMRQRMNRKGMRYKKILDN